MYHSIRTGNPQYGLGVVWDNALVTLSTARLNFILQQPPSESSRLCVMRLKPQLGHYRQVTWQLDCVKTSLMQRRFSRLGCVGAQTGLSPGRFWIADKNPADRTRPQFWIPTLPSAAFSAILMDMECRRDGFRRYAESGRSIATPRCWQGDCLTHPPLPCRRMAASSASMK